MKEKKKYVDYLALIGVFGLSRDFNMYCKKHRGISPRRNARNFLLKSGYFDQLKEFRRIGFEGMADIYKIAQEKIDYGV